MMGLYSYKQRQKDTEWATSIECTRKDCMPANDADDGSDVAVAFGIRVSRTVRVCLRPAFRCIRAAGRKEEYFSPRPYERRDETM